MPENYKKSIPLLLSILLIAWVGIQYLLPIFLPFFLGGLLALASEPLVFFFSRRLPRAGSAALGVTATLVVLVCLLLLISAVVVKEIGLLTRDLPDVGQTALTAMESFSDTLLHLSEKAPVGVRSFLTRAVNDTFDNNSALLTQLIQKIPSLATTFLGWIPGSALALGTGVLSGYMISVRLPKFKQVLSSSSGSFLSRSLPVLQRIRTALGGWLKAQIKLAGVCYLIVATGFLLLRIPHGLLWAVLVALVDAIPILGTGTVLIPWSVICLIQGHTAQGIGLMATYITAMLSRTILEPRFVGKQLGIDPLIALIALYIGFRLWGVTGILIAPLICVAVSELLRARS